MYSDDLSRCVICDNITTDGKFVCGRVDCVAAYIDHQREAKDDCRPHHEVAVPDSDDHIISEPGQRLA